MLMVIILGLVVLLIIFILIVFCKTIDLLIEIVKTSICDIYKYININYSVKSKCILYTRHPILFYFHLEAVRLPCGCRRDKFGSIFNQFYQTQYLLYVRKKICVLRKYTWPRKILWWLN